MKPKLKKISNAVAAAVGAGLVAGAFVSPALAQTSQAVEKIEVTGSYIKRIEGEAALPVTVITIEELAKAGVTNAEQVVKLITQQQGGTVTSGSVSGTNGAASYASLRNLGAQRTLVLLNGKRVVANPFASVAVDLNTLPLVAIQRVEVLSDGASAVYGTDAIAGVINFITRKDFNGVLLGAEAQVPKENGGEVYKFDVMAGMGDLGKSGWNVYAGFMYREGKPMSGIDREFMKSSFIPAEGFNGTSPTTFPANYSQTNTTVTPSVTLIANTNPSLPGCFPPSSILVAPVATNRCNADTQLFTNVIPIQEQWTAFLRGSLALGANHTASFEYFKSNNLVRTQIAPSPEGGLTMTNASPFYPGNGTTPITNTALNSTLPISIAWRTTVLGPRQGEQENNTQRFVANLEGSIAGWDYQVAGLFSDSKVQNFFLNGYPMTVPLIAGVRGTGGAPFLNPFGPQTAAGLAYLQQNQVLGKVQDGEGELTSISGVASRPLFSMPGGPAQMAVSFETRKEEMIYRTDVPKVSQAASSGLAGSGALRQGDRDVDALGLELVFPVQKALELGVSIRHDRYSDFGNTTNPKFSFRYNAVRDLLLRGSYNKGFAAPTLSQLYAPNSTTFTGNRYNDPTLCPGGTPAAGAIPSRDCGIQFQRQIGGNTELTPEKSRAWTLGAVLQITPQVSVGADLWKYEITNNISTIGEQTVFGDPVTYANLFVRCSKASAALQASIGACRTPGGDPLAYIIDVNQNLGNTITRGFDLQFNWQSQPTPYGRFSASVRGSYVGDYQFQVVKNGVYNYPVGNYNAAFGGPVVRYQQITNFGWQKGSWSANILNRYASGYRDQNTAGSVYLPALRNHRVGDYMLYDLSVTFTGFRNMTIQGGILNALDTDPPFTNQAARFQARGYDDRFHNPLGRVYTLSARYTF